MLRSRAAPARPPFQRLIEELNGGDASLSARREWVEVDPWTVDDGLHDVLRPGDRWHEPVEKPEVTR